MHKRKGLPNSVYARVRGMRTPVMVAIALGAFWSNTGAGAADVRGAGVHDRDLYR